MTEETANLALPYILASQAQKHVTHNAALRLLDAQVQLVIQSTRTTPPTSPDEGDCHAVGSGPSGAFTGKAGKIALYEDASWFFITPRQGWTAWFIDVERLKVWTGSAWEEVMGAGTVSRLGINASADETNRLAVSAPATLFNHDGDSHRIKLNKAAWDDTASLLFQQAWSGRAEMGLTGTNNFELKVSADGSDWTTALKTTADGAVLLPGRPLVRASLGETTMTPADGSRTGFGTLHHQQGGFTLGATVPSGTGSRLVVPISGYYLLTMNLLASASTAYTASIQRNGSAVLLTISEGTAARRSATTLAWLDADDYLALRHTGAAEVEFGHGKTELVAVMV